MIFKTLQLIAISIFLACNPDVKVTGKQAIADTLKNENLEIITGADQPELYIPLLKNKKVGLVVNQTSMVDTLHLLDYLLAKNIKVVKIFAPEHGFRGNIDRGGKVSNETDAKTGVPILSLFGNKQQTPEEMLRDLDLVVFDIQDVGVRFFTYISTMHQVMQACANVQKPLLILDRPNPLGDYIDGPVRENQLKSFVGMHPIPVVHGLTVAELAQMINGEHWLDSNKTCDITIIKVKNYTHKSKYIPPVKPSPNLPDYLSIRLYPSLCLFEATNISIGRGTMFPFKVIGYPNPVFGSFTFTPQDIEGMQMNPENEGKLCYGIDLRNLNPDTIQFTLSYIIDFYNKSDFKDTFVSRKKWFAQLSGSNSLLGQITAGIPEQQIKALWQPQLDAYKTMRKKYLLYPD